ncbi:metallophosphoesterase family protein [Paenibacillus hamazuiensis]|uniref:metallophosphoesterase family protein n=1 Tax=Paenibacillus hamazuiensis TaxID=2936508 RepID=UPI00200DC37A|nr:metallophosphoesterase [Paenibacillus hamazuiensis]
MRIGVVSDTHLSPRADRLPQALVDGLQGVELILHAGDWTSPHIADLLGEIAPVDGVAGNNDGSDIIARFRMKKLLTLGSHLVGIVHGHIGSRSTLDNAIEAFRGDGPDVIIFGHSHIPYIGKHQGALLFNPGSPTDKRFQPKYSYGILELGQGEAKATHYYYEAKQ